MVRRRSSAVLFFAVLSAVMGACSSDQGECTYDTDCMGPCKICDTAAHKCTSDPACENIVSGNCESDADCDPLQERCLSGKCVPIEQQDGGEPGDDGDGGPPDGGEQLPDACLNPLLDCSVPQTETEISQGRDRDHDDWGECCDCDDNSAAVNPSRSESVYNCKDDDCNPDTPDDDLDGDGYGSILRGCDPGSDCNDARSDVHPGNTEICDGIDNTCDNKVDVDSDGVSVCQQPECADISGNYHINPNCLAFTEDDVTISQDDCDISTVFNQGQSDEFTCTGTLDPLLNLYVECGGSTFSVNCTSKVSLSQQWMIDCGGGCTFTFTRTSAFTDCNNYNDPACTANGQRCGINCDGDDPRQVCVNTNPGGRQPGYFCNPTSGIDCSNEFCLSNACSSACRNQSDCTSFSGTACQSITYSDCTNSSNLNACVPSVAGETTCHRSADCDPSSNRICTYRKEATVVAMVCRTPSGAGEAGSTCTNQADCKSGFCVCGSELCSGSSGKCSEICSGASDCPSGAECGTVSVPDTGGLDHDLPACTWTGGSCGRDADCPAETPVCTVGVSGDGMSLITFCVGKGMVENPNPGAECSSMWECYSSWCLDFENPPYCAAVCTTDTDCPTFDADPPMGCATDSDCELGYRCYGSQCQRKYVCCSQVFGVGSGVDSVDMCQPSRQQCQLDGDCRAGEACKLYYNCAATSALYLCEKEGPGTGVLGDSCETNGSNDCLSSLCVLESGGGPGNEYCSKSCLTDDDCVDPINYRCSALTVQTPYGYSQAPACVRR